MTSVEFQKKIDVVVGNLINNQLPDFMAMTIVNDLIEGVQTRLQEKGELASGEKPKYSTKSALVGYPGEGTQQNYAAMYKKAYSALKVEGAKWATVKGHKLVEAPGGYKQIRELGGLQTDHVDFTVSNSMLRSVKVKNKRVEGTKIVVTYSPTGTEQEAKVSGHNNRYDENILEPNKAELKQASIRIQKQIIRFLNEGLFGK